MLRLFHPDEGVIEPRRLVVIFMLLVAWICLMWAQFYTESFAFVSMGSMYTGRCTDLRPRTPIPLLFILPFILRHVTVYVRGPAMPLVAVKTVSPLSQSILELFWTITIVIVQNNSKMDCDTDT